MIFPGTPHPPLDPPPARRTRRVRDRQVYEIVHAELATLIETVVGQRAAVRAQRRHERARVRDFGPPTFIRPREATESLDEALAILVHPSLQEDYRQAILNLMRLQAPVSDFSVVRPGK